ncbi:MAG: LysM peptidoglycan-binding domain-containing protein [Anaerolinea sp.]|nr:LysM peptidoglycan-binding domain-containing protein [Anaerolinea sp.]
MRTLLLLVGGLLALGCSLSGVPPATPTLEPTEGTVFIDARDPTALPSSTATATTAPTAVLRPNCYIRTDWFIYWVTRGETLASIARRSGTTAAVLAVANCLANPNLIYAGQLLRVPVLLPPPMTSTPSASSTLVPTTQIPPPTESPTVLPP